ncbi:MAG: hypothetical protein ACM3SU_10920 [Acidobacteriota bacterium]
METDKSAPVDHLSRPHAIDILRTKLKTLTDADHCMCAAATRLGIFCRGFQNLSDEQFRERFWWIARTRKGATRKELEEIVNLYHLGRQEVTGAAICCDVETKEHSACDGWNTFDNATLEKFFLELFSWRVSIG